MVHILLLTGRPAPRSQRWAPLTDRAVWRCARSWSTRCLRRRSGAHQIDWRRDARHGGAPRFQLRVGKDRHQVARSFDRVVSLKRNSQLGSLAVEKCRPGCLGYDIRPREHIRENGFFLLGIDHHEMHVALQHSQCGVLAREGFKSLPLAGSEGKGSPGGAARLPERASWGLQSFQGTLDHQFVGHLLQVRLMPPGCQRHLRGCHPHSIGRQERPPNCGPSSATPGRRARVASHYGGYLSVRPAHLPY